MAALLKPQTAGTHFWAVDKIIFAYLAFTTMLILGWWNTVPGAPVLFGLHVLGVAVVLIEVKRPNRSSWFFRNWYPLLYVASCYREMSLLIPAIRRTDADQWLADLDFRVWQANPTVWLERIHTPVLTEFLQTIYTLFIPMVLLVAVVLWLKGSFGEFQYYAFLIALGFLVSYIGYLIVPARGPRFLLKSMQHIQLQGLWFFQTFQSALDRLEHAHYDCFPSGHTELTILAWWGSRMVAKGMGRVYFIYTPLIIFATVYLRYHYSVDVLAGVAAAAILILLAPFCYSKLSRGYL